MSILVGASYLPQLMAINYTLRCLLTKPSSQIGPIHRSYHRAKLRYIVLMRVHSVRLVSVHASSLDPYKLKSISEYMMKKTMQIIGHNTARITTDHIGALKIVPFRDSLDADTRIPKMMAPSIPWSNYQKRYSEKLTSFSDHATAHFPN